MAEKIYPETFEKCPGSAYFPLLKRQRRPPNSASMIRYALHLRYVPRQACRLLLEKMLSLLLLNNIQQGRVDALKA